ncbi:sialin [Anabrus simplex]|uniref:sialin n=1 Tax=Anabrus simplex TaxID=316456 RepID=UPI0035A28490
MEGRTESTSLVTPKKGYLRYAVAFTLLCGIIINYLIKVMLSVAIVAMVKRQSSSSATNATDNICPGQSNDTEDTMEEGPFDWDTQIQGEILSSYFYGYVATQLLGGWIADHFGGRWVFGPGLFATGVFSVLSPEAAKLDRYVFMALRALQGVASGVLLPSANVIIAKWFTLEERPRIAGFVLSASFGGTLISMSLSGVLVDALGWSSVFYVFGGLSILFILPWCYFVYNSPEVHPRISNWERDHIVGGRTIDSSGTEDVKQEEEQVASRYTPWLSILTSHRFWVLVGVHLGCTWLNYTLLTQLPTYITSVLHFSVQKSGLISSLPYLFGWISAGLYGTLSSWLRNRGYLSQMNAYRVFTGIACVGPAISMLLIVLLGCDTVPIIACLIVTTVMLCAFYGGAVTQHLDIAPNYAGATTGILYTTLNFAGIITPLVTGAILKGQETISGWHTVFYITIGMNLTPYIFYLLFATDKEQSWNKPKMVKTENIIQGAP